MVVNDGVPHYYDRATLQPFFGAVRAGMLCSAGLKDLCFTRPSNQVLLMASLL